MEIDLFLFLRTSLRVSSKKRVLLELRRLDVGASRL